MLLADPLMASSQISDADAEIVTFELNNQAVLLYYDFTYKVLNDVVFIRSVIVKK